MTNGMLTVPLGEFLKQRKEFFIIDDFSKYKRARVKSHGQGIVLRDEVNGTEIKTKKQQAARAGEFLVAEIDAKVGGFGIVPPELDGAVVSSHYFLFEIDESKCSKEWLNWFVRYNSLEEQTKAQGSTNYAAIRPSHVLNFEIPLPPLMEQHRIVEDIESLATRVNEVQRLREEAEIETNALLHSIKSKVFETEENTTVKDFADIQSGYAFKSEWFSAEGIRLVRNVNIGHNEIRWNDTARIPFEKQNDFPAFELHEGDILISLDRPLISSGLKAAKVRKQDLPSLLLQRVGRVIFKNSKVLPDYFYQWLNSPSFISSIDPGRSNGVPHISPKDVEKIPFALPPLDEQRRVVAYLDGLDAKVNTLRELQSASGEELSALMPSVLDRAFKGEL